MLKRHALLTHPLSALTVKTRQKQLAKDHPQLFHYTNAAGLEGILRSQTLRATHYRYLNDIEEIRHFLKNELPKVFQLVYFNHGELKEEALHLGNKAAKSLEEKLLNSTNSREPLAEPYITSFCTPRESDSRVGTHGLLSQWRGYGKAGGFALVFETALLSELLTDFAESYKNSGDLFAGDVVYSSDSDQVFTEEFAEDLTVMEEFLSSQLRGNEDDESLWKVYSAVIQCACRYKHWGFKEENEVRLIFIPHSKEVREYARNEEITIKEVPRKQFIRGGTNVPFVDLLEKITSSNRPLPIQRVIVGPCAEHERDRRVRSVEILLQEHNIDAKVTVSEIPYVG